MQSTNDIGMTNESARLVFGVYTKWKYFDDPFLPMGDRPPVLDLLTARGNIPFNLKTNKISGHVLHYRVDILPCGAFGLGGMYTIALTQPGPGLSTDPGVNKRP